MIIIAISPFILSTSAQKTSGTASMVSIILQRQGNKQSGWSTGIATKMEVSVEFIASYRYKFTEKKE